MPQLLTFFIAIVLLCAQCTPERHPETTCDNGFEPDGADCICPEGKHEAYGICRALEAGERYGRTPADCPCSRGVFFTLVAKNGDKVLKEAIIRTMGPHGDSIESPLFCTERPDGDSIFGDYSSHYYCARADYYFWVYANGKFVSPDSLRMDLTFTPVALTAGAALPPQNTYRFWLTR